MMDGYIKDSWINNNYDSDKIISHIAPKGTLIIENTSGLTYDPIPKGIPENMYMKCKSTQELELALNKFLSLSQEQISLNLNRALKIREQYFEPVTKDGLNRFLDIRE